MSCKRNFKFLIFFSIPSISSTIHQFIVYCVILNSLFLGVKGTLMVRKSCCFSSSLTQFRFLILEKIKSV